MPGTQPHRRVAADSSAQAIRCGAALLVATTVLVYVNSLSSPFFFDDLQTVVENRSIRRLSTALSPPTDGNAAMGRPIVNLSLALNHALGGLKAPGYHAFNVALHALSTLCLFGVVRRTLLTPRLRERFSDAATRIALASAVLWGLHPLQTESVTIVSQRTELLVGFFLLLTLLAFVRHTENPPSRRWAALAIGACLLGMASKEVMVVAPVLVLLYDRTFVAGTFRDAWRTRARLHVALFATWLVLAALLIQSGGSRNTAAGFGLGMSPWSYALKQCEAIVHYLRLVVWPDRLVVDYGAAIVERLRDVLPQAIAVAALVAATGVALWRAPVLGFCGAWFLAILGPSSSFVPLVTQTMAEHRMYLPLAAPVVLAVVIGQRQAGRHGVVLAAAMALALGVLTIARNAVYQSELRIWTDTVAKQPENPRAQNFLGNALAAAGRRDEAETRYREALRISPELADAHSNLGHTLHQRGRVAEAVSHYEAALRSKPALRSVHSNLALALLDLGRVQEAIDHGQQAVRIDPDYAPGHHNLGLALTRARRAHEAIPHLETALRHNPDYADGHNALGAALATSGQLEAARRHFETALRLKPDLETARENLRQLEAMQASAGR